MKPLDFKRFIPRYKILMDSIQEMIIIFNTHGRIVDCNREALKELGYDENIYNCQISDIFRNIFIYQKKQIIVGEKYNQKTAEAVAYRKNQTCFQVDLKITLFKERGFNFGVCTALNISEKKEAVQELIDAKNELANLNQSNNEFIANMTHELRTPINGIMGFSNSLLDTELTQRQLEDINIIKRCCSTMSSIVNNILDYTKLANNKLELENREFNLPIMLRNIIEINSKQINEKGLKFFMDISADIPEIVVGDEFRLTQIINNLFSNAIKFTPAGHIGFEVTKIGEINQSYELFFVLFDTGIGISPEDKDKLFKSFSQVDSSITRIFGGTGLGLSICKRLVDSMGGTIRVESEKDKGSAFVFSVHLGIPKGTKNPESTEPIITEQRFEPEPEPDISEFEYISRKLKEPYKTSSQKTGNYRTVKMDTKSLITLTEKIVICIEMENWSKAEELVSGMKKLTSNTNADLSKKILSLLLVVRKENREKSMLLLADIKAVLSKEV